MGLYAQKNQFAKFPKRAILEPICRFLFSPYKSISGLGRNKNRNINKKALAESLGFCENFKLILS